MSNQRVLLTGDYWHRDFQQIISNSVVPLTMTPIDRIEAVANDDYQLIVIAQSRRDQYSQEFVEAIRSLLPNTPIFNLLGTWCEGESRSGRPLHGLTRVYWHQWEGRFESFLEQARENGDNNLQLPATASIADRVRVPRKHFSETGEIEWIGVSAWTQSPFEMIADAVSQFGWKAKWVERTMWDGESQDLISVICVDANSWTYDLQQRVKWLRTEFPNKPIVLLLNFPRPDELPELIQQGISQVVSKPFELDDLRLAFERSFEKHRLAANSAM